MPIHEGLLCLSTFILFQTAFTKSHRLQKSCRRAFLYHILRYIICAVFTCCMLQRGIDSEMYGKCKHVTLFTKLYTLPPCLKMFLIATCYVNYFKGHHYINAYTDWVIQQHYVHRYKNAVGLWCNFHISSLLPMRVCFNYSNAWG